MFSHQELETLSGESNSQLSRSERVRRGARIGVLLGAGLPSIAILATIVINPKEAAQAFTQDPKEFLETIAFLFSIHTVFVTAMCTGMDGYIIPMIDKIFEHIQKLLLEKLENLEQ